METVLAVCAVADALISMYHVVVGYPTGKIMHQNHQDFKGDDCMYRELDDLLSEESTIDSWYDDGFLIAQSIMNDFTGSNWERLSDDVLNKELDWQKNLVYCLGNQIIQEELV